jgi:aspartyl/asparaginyl beta-hydroxylase (cupin superfamily)
LNATSRRRVFCGWAPVRRSQHRDYDLGIEDGHARVHVPIVTNPLVEFYLDEQLVEMREGEAWYLNLNLFHRVENKGSDDRVHLVIDCIVNDWLRAFFPAEDQDQ